MAVLDAEHFEELFERVAKQGRSHRATAHEQMNRKLFLDLLCYAGTTDAALFIKKLYEQDRVTTSEAKEMIESVPQNLFLVDAKVVEEYLNMFLSEKVQQQRHLASSTGIALGKLINQATIKRQQIKGDIHDEQSIRRQQHAQAELKRNTIRVRRSAPWHQHFRHDLLEQNEVSQVLQVLAKALKTCTTFHQKVTLIETLAHTGTAEALAILAPYVQDKVSNEEMPGYPIENESEVSQERNFIRQVCIYALTHIASANSPQVRALMLPIFQNKNEPYEVRIAAFTVLLGCNPGKYVLERISTEMHHENNRQVKSFVISSLETMANFTEPSTRQLAEDARFALGFAPKDESGIYYSKMFGQSYYDESKQYGMNIMAEWVSSNVSKFPRSGYLAVRETDGPTQEIPIELGYNVKGLDSIIERLTSSNGIINDVLQSFNSYGKDRRLMKRKAGSAQETWRTLKEKLDLTVRTEEEPKATVFFKLFEKTSYFAFDRQYVQQLLDSAEDSIKDIIGQLTQGQQYHYIKLVLPKQMYKVVSSEIGLPIVITQRYPTIVSVKINEAKVEFVKRQRSEQEQDRTSSSSSDSSSFPQGVNFTAQIEPSIHHSSYYFIFALTPITTEAIGAHICRESRVAIPLDLSVSYLNTNKQLSWSITPRVPQEIYHHQTQIKTFIAKAKIAGSPDREWLSETSSSIRTQSVPFKYEKQYGKRELGIGLNVKVTTESAKRFSQPLFKSETAEKYGYLAGLVELWNNDEMTPCSVHLMLEADEQNPVTGLEMAIRYKKLHLAENLEDSEESTTFEDDEYQRETDDQENFVRNRQQKMWKRNEKMSKWSSLKELKQSIKNMVHKWNKDVSDSVHSVSDKIDLKAHCIEIKARTQSAEAKNIAVKFLLAHTYDSKHYWTKVRAVAESQETESDETKESQKNLCFDS
ncbi:vitellogenin-like protein, partial [Euroglyphus maynei]